MIEGTTPIIGGGVASYLSWFLRLSAGITLLTLPFTLTWLCLALLIYRIIH